MDLVLHLRGFVAVAEELSVSEAAFRLGLDQPLLSRRLRTLERELDVELVDRSRRRITLTPDGAALLPRARHLVDQADHLVRTVRDADTTTVTLSTPPESDPAALARLVSLFDRAEVDVELVSADADAGAPHADSSWTVRSCDPASARWTARLGAASTACGPGDPPCGSLRCEGTRGEGTRCEGALRGGPLRLSELRPRRGAPARPLLVLPHDLEPPRGEHLHATADAAGLSPALIRPRPAHIAMSEALAGRAVLLCTAGEASRYGLSWTPLADPPVLRGYRLAERDPLPPALAADPLRTQALRLLGDVVASEPDTHEPRPGDPTAGGSSPARELP
ncbi:DNA-binding transcriptional LysR family regulator [Prauserella isguenensis]|uniref:DNA-binding transcriptional LysR family regulator n=1 Tax=Prauserella isguenensis TaxID=1470180 RepID=A0A839S0P4_9PSEU|nr:DNA-binding transcriptional LysR family regulator [Prauserella isguenensis]